MHVRTYGSTCARQPQVVPGMLSPYRLLAKQRATARAPALTVARTSPNFPWLGRPCRTSRCRVTSRCRRAFAPFGSASPPRPGGRRRKFAGVKSCLPPVLTANGRSARKLMVVAAVPWKARCGSLWKALHSDPKRSAKSRQSGHSLPTPAILERQLDAAKLSDA